MLDEQKEHGHADNEGRPQLKPRTYEKPLLTSLNNADTIMGKSVSLVVETMSGIKGPS
jgi:hypothetical protein